MSNKIAVIIANYNYGHFISDAIESCISQTRKPDVVVIVDDNSNDGSKELIHEKLSKVEYSVEIINNLSVYSYDYEGVKFVFIPLEKTGGPSLTRNIAIDLTVNQIDFYQILDSDDIMYSDKLKSLEQKMMESPEIGVVYADYDILNVNTNNLIREFKKPYTKRDLLQECIVHSGAMIRKNALLATRDQFGYYDVNLRCAEDYDLWLRISERFTIAHVPQPLTLVRVHPNNATFSVKNEVWQACWNRVKQKLMQRGA